MEENTETKVKLFYPLTYSRFWRLNIIKGPTKVAPNKQPYKISFASNDKTLIYQVCLFAHNRTTNQARHTILQKVPGVRAYFGGIMETLISQIRTQRL